MPETRRFIVTQCPTVDPHSAMSDLTTRTITDDRRSPMGEIDVYRIKPTSDRLRRTWEAEWAGCRWAPRAWTERGIWRKARRWQLWHRDKSKLRPTFSNLLSRRP